MLPKVITIYRFAQVVVLFISIYAIDKKPEFVIPSLLILLYLKLCEISEVIREK